jgi:hypothetical protein
MDSNDWCRECSGGGLVRSRRERALLYARDLHNVQRHRTMTGAHGKIAGH